MPFTFTNTRSAGKCRCKNATLKIMYLNIYEESDDYFSKIFLTGREKIINPLKSYLEDSFSISISELPGEYDNESGDFPGSKLEKIGGIFANVKPKKKVAIKIYQRRESKEKYLVILTTGIISQNVAKQSVRVRFQSPIFADVYKDTKTNGF